MKNYRMFGSVEKSELVYERGQVFSLFLSTENTTVKEKVALLQEKALAETVGVYVHVPFCATACDFCAFYQEVPDAAKLDAYVDGLRRELEQARWDGHVDTCFIGGGTPGVLAARRLEQVLTLLRQRFATVPAEWTVEVDPTTATREKLEIMRGFGVNRLSIGAQSFDTAQLDRLGRKHKPDAVRRTVATARDLGFDNINIDLMFAYTGQAVGEWLADIAAAAGLEPTHISTYCLTLEEDTALYLRMMRSGTRKDPDEERDLYIAGWEELEERLGFNQYEVSNFCRPGFACQHNLHTWKMGQWLGFGPSAASQWQGRRWTNIDSIEEWHQGLFAGRPCYREELTVDPSTMAIDRVIFGLRMRQGIDWQQLRTQLPHEESGRIESELADLVAEGLAISEPDGRIRLSRDGMLVADAIAVRLI